MASARFSSFLKLNSIRELDQSFMPEGLVYSLTDRELRDLLAFLAAPEERSSED